MRIGGIIEGFYGPPWSHRQRLDWIERLDGWSMTHYVWAAKLEPRHRGPGWVEPFTADELEQFAELAAHRPAVALAVGLTPGRDATAEQMITKLSPAVAAGARVVVLSVDDLPALDAGFTHRDLAHALQAALGCGVWIVPTHYAGSCSSQYLDALCDGLDPSIEVMWTGEHVVNETITVEQADARARATGRAPLLWDNTPVNDAVMRDALHLGPLTGREPGLRSACSGVLWNPMEFAVASLPTLASAAAWWRGDDPLTAWTEAVRSLGTGAERLAAATAFAGDGHWPVGPPTLAWWQQMLAELPTDAVAAGLDPGTQPWIDAAREGAAIAVDAVTVAEQFDSGAPIKALMVFGLAVRWRTWRRRDVLTFGAGPRIRPVAGQDSNGAFVIRAGTIELGSSLVDDAVSALLERFPTD